MRKLILGTPYRNRKHCCGSILEKGGVIKHTYEDFDKDYDAFTDYVMDRISLEERRKIRKDWNTQHKTGIKNWEKYLLKRVNEKHLNK